MFQGKDWHDAHSVPKKSHSPCADSQMKKQEGKGSSWEVALGVEVSKDGSLSHRSGCGEGNRRYI